jgi:hypothetical protein
VQICLVLDGLFPNFNELLPTQTRNSGTQLNLKKKNATAAHSFLIPLAYPIVA